MIGRMVAQKSVKNNAVFNVLKAAWANHDSVRTSDIDEWMMAFEFEYEKERDRVLDMSLWSIHGHCLNLEICGANQCV